MRGGQVLTEEDFAMLLMLLKEDQALKEDRSSKTGPVQKTGPKLEEDSTWSNWMQKQIKQPERFCKSNAVRIFISPE